MSEAAPTTTHTLMEAASRALAAMDYLTCEARCLEALAQARAAGAWAEYARILLPLQEARRQRRMIACDAGVWTVGQPADLDRVPEAGCVVVLPPMTAPDAAQLEADAHAARRHVEVLHVTSDPAAAQWSVASFRGPSVACALPAPANQHPDVRWYLEAGETLGDAAIAQVEADGDAPPGSVRRVDRLQAMLAVVVDHEKLHQRLGDAA
ncbi:MAG: hypothetical protein GVY24_04925, partial [Planctomycetes bacterium]|nr:hypothetical protein [Planctomycetota bacterium]